MIYIFVEEPFAVVKIATKKAKSRQYSNDKTKQQNWAFKKSDTRQKTKSSRVAEMIKKLLLFTRI